MSNSFVTQWSVAHQVPLSMKFPGKNTGGVAISFSRGSSWPRDWTHISCTGRQNLYHWATGKPDMCIKWHKASILKKHINHIFNNKYRFINEGPNFKFLIRLVFRNNSYKNVFWLWNSAACPRNWYILVLPVEIQMHFLKASSLTKQ